MTNETVTVTLTKKEWNFIAAMRDIPPGQLKDLMDDLLTSIIDLTRNPTCVEVQADGVPCATTAADCEQCVKVKGVLETLKHNLQQH
jgi:hypothetical protein